MTPPTYLTATSLSFVHSKRSLFLAIYLLLPLSVSAAQSDALLPDMNAVTSLKEPIQLHSVDMSTAVKRAIAWHPMVTGARERTNQQGEEVSFAKSAYFPQIRGGVNTNYRDSRGRSEEAFTISGSQLLYDFGKVASNVEAAEYGVERNEADTLRVIDQLIRETAFAVLEVQRYQLLVKTAVEQVAGVSELLEAEHDF